MKSNQPTTLEEGTVTEKLSHGPCFVEAEIQNFGHLMQRADSLEKTLMMGKIEGRRKRG